ncbi:MAG: Cytoskeleton protein RodZ [Rhodocyclaceae bacterium]|nr:Cytoskeleton protein RodZ [Rhodocyclaceae bacterium]
MTDHADKPIDELTQPIGPGEQLKSRREAQGMSVAEASQALRLSPAQVEAIELERFGDLKGATFARGFVRNYARLLGMDPAPLLAAMDTLHVVPTPHIHADRQATVTLPHQGGRRNLGRWLAGGVLVALLFGVMGILFASGWFEELTDSIPPTPQQVAVPGKPGQTRPPDPPPVQGSAVVPLLPPSTAGTPNLAPTTERELRFSFAQEAWLEVTDADGTSLIAELVPSGRERVIRGRAPFTLVVGNAHGVTVQLDGQKVDLGPSTQTNVARLRLP